MMRNYIILKTYHLKIKVSINLLPLFLWFALTFLFYFLSLRPSKEYYVFLYHIKVLRYDKDTSKIKLHNVTFIDYKTCSHLVNK